MKKALSLLVVLTLALTMLAGSMTAVAESLPVIKIASATPLSGSQAAMGESIKNGIELALHQRVEEFKALGFDLQFSPQDDQADPKVGVSVAQRLIEDKDILAVVGHWNSGVAIPSSEVYLQGNLTMVSPANTATDVTDRGLPNVNRICARDDAQGVAIAEYLMGIGMDTLFIVQDKTTYGQGIADAVQANYSAKGGAVLGYEGITSGEADFSAVEEMIRASGAKGVFFGGTYPDGGLLIKQLKEKGIDVTFIGPDGMDNAELINIAGDAVVGTFYTSVASLSTSSEKGAAFIKAYTEKYGKAPEGFTAYGFDAMNVTLDAIKKVIADKGGALPTREEVMAAARATTGFEGVATNVTFDEKGDNTLANLYILGFKEAAYPPETIQAIAIAEAMGQ
ncbi:MAG: branched-chain amino acid ABC transporter substrate-binding protein [Candidatus Limiplasma sp.]|nr:branched-chain amino acid ABC transporter substrate-binding protein [Candidatus Limiplasma sp.]